MLSRIIILSYGGIVAVLTLSHRSIVGIKTEFSGEDLALSSLITAVLLNKKVKSGGKSFLIHRLRSGKTLLVYLGNKTNYIIAGIGGETEKNNPSTLGLLRELARGLKGVPEEDPRLVVEKAVEVLKSKGFFLPPVL